MKLYSPRIWAIALAAIGLTLTAQPAKAGYINLTTADSTGTIGGAFYFQGEVGSGTGVFPAFVRVHKNGTEHAYNTTANVLDNTSDDTHNHELLFSSLGVVTYGGNSYFEFRLDINESGGNDNQYLSLDRLQIYTSTTANQNTTNVSTLGTLQYDSGAGNGVLMNYDLEAGSGKADLRVLIPVFTPGAGELYVYLYSSFGALGELGAGNSHGAPPGKYDSTDGFEEWSFKSGGSGGGGGVVPAPAGLILLATAVPVLAFRRLVRRKPVAA